MYKLKNVPLFVVMILIGTAYQSCKDDELPPGGIEITEGTALVWERACDYHTLHIDTELPWTIEVESTWITPLIMEGNGATDLQVYVEENNNDGDRKGFIRITPQGYKATEISVTQKGKNTSDDNSTREMKNLIGFGYDLSGDYLSPQSIKAQVFNFEKVDNRYRDCSTTCDTIEWSLTNRNINFLPIGNDFLRKEMGITYTYSIPLLIESFYSGESKNSVYNKTACPLISKHDISHRHRSIHNYYYAEKALTEDFIKEIKDAPNHRTNQYLFPYKKEYIYNLFDKFGTHVIVAEYYGGSIIHGITIGKDIADSGLMRVGALNIGWKKRFGLSLNKEERFLAQDISKNYSDKMTIMGGDESILANLLTEDGSCTAQELENWGKSLSTENQALIRITVCTIFDVIPHELQDDHEIDDPMWRYPIGLNSIYLNNMIDDYYKNRD